MVLENYPSNFFKDESQPYIIPGPLYLAFLSYLLLPTTKAVPHWELHIPLDEVSTNTFL
jgi:hypothetical protein